MPSHRIPILVTPSHVVVVGDSTKAPRPPPGTEARKSPLISPHLVVIPPEQQEVCEEIEDANVCGVQLIGTGEKLETISKTL